MNKNRCGADGVLENAGNDPVFVVRELITKIEYAGGLKLVLAQDISVGDRIPVAQIAREHRGIAFYDEKNVYLDEGEFWPKNIDGKQQWIFYSDYDGPLSHLPVADLKPYKVELKPEIYDQIGAERRLRLIKKAFQL